MDLALRPRTATEIVDAAVRLVRRHVGAFLTLAAVAAVPRLLIGGAQFLAARGTTAGLAAAGAAGVAANPFALFTGTYLLLTIAALVVYGAFEAAFITLADDALRTGDASAGRALGRGMARAVPVIVTFLIVSVATFVGLIFLIVPGVYLGVRLYPAVATAALEDVGPGEAIGRAWRRTAGSVGRGFVVYLLVLLLAMLIGLAFSMLGAVLGGVVGAAVGGVTGAVGAGIVTGVLANVLAGLLYYPVLSAAGTVFYYDTRVRAEGLDVELMADALGRPSAAAY